jgi:predicted ester cyclase
VAARFLVEVDHVGEFQGIAPSGRRISFTGMALYRMERGQIAETWLQLDGLSFLGQLGAIPAQAA